MQIFLLIATCIISIYLCIFIDWECWRIIKIIFELPIYNYCEGISLSPWKFLPVSESESILRLKWLFPERAAVQLRITYYVQLRLDKHQANSCYYDLFNVLRSWNEVKLDYTQVCYYVCIAMPIVLGTLYYVELHL